MAKADLSRLGGARRVRCAVYTRKSTDDGLEQEFNSLDAQREACAAYVLSQRHEGWNLLPDLYDDGGFSGGTMDRPALKRLLLEVKAGRVDVIVVYKVDRLTRSLADFAKIVEILDENEASFVSVTQAFNTTTSMGRLTLNVLLSFAQFEREVTGERIRDKIAASKKKGMWMGGTVPLGYEVRDRKLVVNETEAEQVRHMFERYLELGTVVALRDDLAARGIMSKRRVSRDGHERGGCAFTYGPLRHLIRNRVYIGEVHHKGKHYPGEHAAIVDVEVFERAQAQLERNRVDRKCGVNLDDPSLMAGLLFDGSGRRMSASHAAKGSRRYRYYVSAPPGGSGDDPPVRVPAGELETVVMDRLILSLRGPEILHRVIDRSGAELRLSGVAEKAEALANVLSAGMPSERRAAVLNLVRRIDVHRDRLGIQVNLDRFVAAPDNGGDAVSFELSTPIAAVRAGKEVRMVVPPSAGGGPTRRDPSLIGLVVKAYAARKVLLSRPGATLDDIVTEFGLARDYFRVLVKISFLAPTAVSAILEGRQPVTLTRQRLARISDLPLEWERQREVLGFSPELTT